MEIYLPRKKIDSRPFQKPFSLLDENKGGADAVGTGDGVPEGGRSGEAKPRTGGAAGSPPVMFAPGAEGGKWTLLKFLSYPQNLLLNYRILYRFFI